MKTQNTTSNDNTIPVVLIRHAQSQWNKENRFTGWADPELTDSGMKEAIAAAHLLQKHGYKVDVTYSSRLQRAITSGAGAVVM